MWPSTWGWKDGFCRNTSIACYQRSFLVTAAVIIFAWFHHRFPSPFHTQLDNDKQLINDWSEIFPIGLPIIPAMSFSRHQKKTSNCLTNCLNVSKLLPIISGVSFLLALKKTSAFSIIGNTCFKSAFKLPSIFLVCFYYVF